MTLASIQKIDKIVPIDGADRIETAHVLGWQVVVKKGEFKEGDLCVYIEIDTLVPNKEWSKFLFTGSHENDEYYRLRTIKLRGQISQGLVIPASIVSEQSWTGQTLYKYATDDNDTNLYIGRDVHDVLGIKKYEKPMLNINIGGQRIKARSFPPFIPRTDEIRIQSKPELLEQLRGKPYYITQKLDGTSSTFYKYKGKFGVCSRNMDLGDPHTHKGLWQFIKREFRKLIGKTKKEFPATNVYWSMARKYNVREWLPDGYAVQGEICGPGIQENKMGLAEVELFIFNVWNINEQRYATFDEHVRLYGSTQTVPILYIDKSAPFFYNIEELLELAKGNYPNGTPQEGIVVRSLDQAISFKVINNDFLLKYGE